MPVYTKNILDYDVAIIMFRNCKERNFGFDIEVSEITKEQLIERSEKVAISDEESFLLYQGRVVHVQGEGRGFHKALHKDAIKKEVLIASDDEPNDMDRAFYFLIPRGIDYTQPILRMVNEIIQDKHLPDWPWEGIGLNRELTAEIENVCYYLFKDKKYTRFARGLLEVINRTADKIKYE